MRMLRSGRGDLARALAVGAIVLLACPQTTVAQGTGVQGGCLLSPAKLSDDAIKSFKDRPPELLALYPDAGPPMSQYVRRLAGSDVSTVPLLIGLAKDAGPAHVVAIGVGLARAAAVCTRTRPELTQAIRDQVSQSGLQALISAFAVGLSSYEVTGVGAPDTPAAGNPIANQFPAGGGAVMTGSAISSDPATSVVVGNTVIFGSGGGRRGSAAPAKGPDGPSDQAASRAVAIELTFGSGGILKTFGDAVSPTR